MKPIQLWLPTIGRSLGDRRVAADAQRAFEQWHGESRVYLLTGPRNPVRWTDQPGGNDSSAVAITGELVEVVSVLHVGENEILSGAIDELVLPAMNAYSLLRSWLNLRQSGEVRVEPAAKVMGTLRLPKFQNSETVTYYCLDIARARGPVFEALAQDDAETVEWTCAIPGRPRPVFPDTESIEAFWKGAPQTRKNISGRPISSISLVVTGILAPLFRFGFTIDAMHHLEKMAAMVQLSTSDLGMALAGAKAFAASYLSEGESTRELSWFRPLIAQVGLETAIQRGGQLGLTGARTLRDVARSRTWQAKLAEQVPVTRAWGPIGLFWALVIQRLEERRPFSVCEACGRALDHGRKRKTYCGQSDSVECFKKRMNRYKRESRYRAS